MLKSNLQFRNLILGLLTLVSYVAASHNDSVWVSTVVKKEERFKVIPFRIALNSVHVEFYNHKTDFYSFRCQDIVSSFEGDDWMVFMWCIMKDYMKEKHLDNSSLHYTEIIDKSLSIDKDGNDKIFKRFKVILH